MSSFFPAPGENRRDKTKRQKIRYNKKDKRMNISYIVLCRGKNVVCISFKIAALLWQVDINQTVAKINGNRNYSFERWDILSALINFPNWKYSFTSIANIQPKSFFSQPSRKWMIWNLFERIILVGQRKRYFSFIAAIMCNQTVCWTESVKTFRQSIQFTAVVEKLVSIAIALWVNSLSRFVEFKRLKTDVFKNLKNTFDLIKKRIIICLAVYHEFVSKSYFKVCSWSGSIRK